MKKFEILSEDHKDNVWKKNEHEQLEDRLNTLYGKYDDIVVDIVKNQKIKDEIQDEIKKIESRIGGIEHKDIWSLPISDFLDLKLF